uniref:MIF4G domain-containing protein n=1 Tax=Romanomermis culicivorax TaxID=13658 RepID=A0A915J9J2_ROMCU
MDPMKGLSDNFAQQINLGSGSSETSANSSIPTSAFSGNIFSGASTSYRNVPTPKKTDWKLDAPEFVPRSSAALTNAADTSHATHSNVDFRAIEEASEQVGQLEHLTGVKSRSTATYTLVLEENLDFTDNIIAELQNNPESIENLSSQLLEYIYANVIDYTALTTIFSRLLDAAITVPNFAFICVRLMVWISDNFDSKTATLANFQRADCRDCLIGVLEAEFKTRKAALEDRKEKGDELPRDEETQRLFVYVNALCMFSTLMSCQGKPYKVLVFAIYEILRKIVEQRLDNYVRFGIQTLKTVGAHLESTEKLEKQHENSESETPLMDKLIDVLECIVIFSNNAEWPILDCIHRPKFRKIVYSLKAGLN